MRTLEERMGVRLPARTTRGASLTEARERLLSNLSPHYEGIEAELAAISDLRQKRSGTIHSTRLPSGASGMTIGLMPVEAVAPCQCFTPGGRPASEYGPCANPYDGNSWPDSAIAHDVGN